MVVKRISLRAGALERWALRVTHLGGDSGSRREKPVFLRAGSFPSERGRWGSGTGLSYSWQPKAEDGPTARSPCRQPAPSLGTALCSWSGLP